MNNRSVLVYVSGPISKGVLVDNIYNAMNVGISLIRAGFSVIVPHANCFMEAEIIHDHAFSPTNEQAGIVYEDWMEMDFEIITRCNCVLRIPGESSGGDREVEFARALGMPVFFDMVELLKAYGMKPNE